MLGYELGLGCKSLDWSAVIGDVSKWDMKAVQLQGNYIPYNIQSGQDSRNESGVEVLSLRRVLSAKIISVSKQTFADIDGKGTEGVEGGGGPLGLGETNGKGVICIEIRSFTF